MYFIHCILTNTFRPLLLPPSVSCYYYKNTTAQMWLAVSMSLHNSSNRYTTPSTHHLQPVPTAVPHRLHITYNHFQWYITPSTHHLQPVPTAIPHRLHITYKQFQPVYHTVYTSPTTSSNRCITASAHHLQPVPTGIPHRLTSPTTSPR